MDLQKVGRLIAKKRKEKNYTQEKLSELLGISSKTISKWERGVNAPDISLLKELSETLDISIEELLLGEETNNNESIIDGISYYTQKEKNKYFRITTYIVLFLIISFLTLFLINNYNKFKVYTISSNDNQYIIQGYLIINPERHFLIINEIDLRNMKKQDIINKKIDKINISFYSNNKLVYNEYSQIDTKETVNSYLFKKVFVLPYSINKGNFKTNEKIIRKNNRVIIEFDINKKQYCIRIPILLQREYSNNKLLP